MALSDSTKGEATFASWTIDSGRRQRVKKNMKYNSNNLMLHDWPKSGYHPDGVVLRFIHCVNGWGVAGGHSMSFADAMSRGEIDYAHVRSA